MTSKSSNRKKIKTSTFEPLLLLVSDKNGLCLLSESFDYIKINEQLVCGLISAIRSMMIETFQINKDEICYGNYNIKSVSIDDFLIHLVYRGDKNTGIQYLTSIIDNMITEGIFQELIEGGCIGNNQVNSGTLLRAKTLITNL